MSLTGWLTTIAASWAVLAGLGGFTWAFVATRLKRLRKRRTVTGTYPPPITPRITQADIDACWLADQPADVAAVDELDRRFFAIVDQETRWFA